MNEPVYRLNCKERPGLISLDFFKSHIFETNKECREYLENIKYYDKSLVPLCLEYFALANTGDNPNIQHVNTMLCNNYWKICIAIYDKNPPEQGLNPPFSESLSDNKFLLKFSIPYISRKQKEYIEVILNSSELEPRLNQFNEQGYKIISVTNNGRDIDWYRVLLYKQVID